MEYESKLWGAHCSCSSPNVVHQNECQGCGRIIGQITDDDFCGPEKLYCPDCVDKHRPPQKKIRANKKKLII